MQFIHWFEGFALTAGLIMAIGAQNAFVLRQGIKRQHLWLTALTCVICDSLLVVAGVSGVGVLIREIPLFMDILRYAGALFLTGYGIRSFMNVFRPHALIANLKKGANQTWQTTLLALLAFTFLNPHTYIDTVLLIGSVGAEHPPHERLSFILGALSASCVWFFGLTFGASALSPVFRNPKAWQVLDAITGCVMFGMAMVLLF